MNETLSPVTQLTETSGEEITYRAVSRPAVASLLLGAASALALVHPLLWLLPPLAIAAAVFALRSIAARPSELAGKGIAYAGLALAVVFGSLAPARLLTRESRIYHEAKLHADSWFQLISEGKLYEAYELRLRAQERHAEATNWESIYGEKSTLTEPAAPTVSADPRSDLRTSIRMFYSNEPAKTLVVGGKSAELVFQGNESHSYTSETSTDDMTLRYELRYLDQGQPKRKTLRVTLSRTYDSATKSASWHVAGLTDQAP